MFLKINIASADYLILTNGKVSANTNLIGPTAYRFETSINIGGVNYSLSLHYEAQEALLFSVILPSVCLFYASIHMPPPYSATSDDIVVKLVIFCVQCTHAHIT